MEYYEVDIKYKDTNLTDAISALVFETGADSVWEKTPEHLVAYFKLENNDVQTIQEDVQKVLQGIAIDSIEHAHMPARNWNESWEKNFEAVEISDFCYVYADFHTKKTGFEQYIKIAPKMAFGTAHHETTYMMMQQMREIHFDSCDVLDFGCGSGILAVLAKKLQAKSVLAVDVEAPAVENALEHASINKVQYDVELGDIHTVPDQKYQIILANVNQNVLIADAKELIDRLDKNATLLLSGILIKDKQRILDAYSSLKLEDIIERGKWLCFRMKNNTET